MELSIENIKGVFEKYGRFLISDRNLEELYSTDIDRANLNFENIYN